MFRNSKGLAGTTLLVTPFRLRDLGVNAIGGNSAFVFISHNYHETVLGFRGRHKIPLVLMQNISLMERVVCGLRRRSSKAHTVSTG